MITVILFWHHTTLADEEKFYLPTPTTTAAAIANGHSNTRGIIFPTDRLDRFSVAKVQSVLRLILKHQERGFTFTNCDGIIFVQI